MFVGLKMLKNFITMPPDALVEDAQRLMDEQQLWMLFVVKDGKLVGYVRQEDINAAMPSLMTGLDKHELNYLLSKLTVGRIMRVAGSGDDSLEAYMLPMALANDAVIRDGACIGDPTEGALVVLAAKGGIDVDVQPIARDGGGAGLPRRHPCGGSCCPHRGQMCGVDPLVD